MSRPSLSAAHGLYLIATGVWPLVHYRSFERVSGPKVDKWLVQTVAGLATTAGWAMLRAGRSPESVETVRRLGIGSALTFGLVDAVYGASGRIRRIYLADAVIEAAWLAAWARRGSPTAQQDEIDRPPGADHPA